MFDFAWSEIALIGVVALIAIGPKDLPVAIKSVAAMVKKARRMAGEFQTHVDEMVREANLSEVRNQISEFRTLDLKGTIERAIDGDGSIRRTFTEDPLREPLVTPPPPAQPATDVQAAPSGDVAILDRPDAAAADTAVADHAVADHAVAETVLAEAAMRAPAFIPPAIASPPPCPAFIPPSVARAEARRSPG